ncbi:MAG: porin [Azonexus sp.]|nr:porin [Azonexus sp.]
MQKKIIALAIAGLASTAAFAQSNVTIYGIADYGYSYRTDSTANGPRNGDRSAGQFNAGQAAGSRIGFKGVEDLGNGLKAVFLVEQGLNIDTTTGDVNANANNIAFVRQAYGGLTGGFGTVVGGRLYSPHFTLVSSLDPFGRGTVGTYANTYGGGLFDPTRVNNAVAYVSPSFGGFVVTAAYSNGALANDSVVSNAYNDTVYALLGRYTAGPVDVGVNYHYIAAGSTAGPTIAGLDTVKSVQNITIGGSFDAKVVKIAGWYSNNVQDNVTGVSDAKIDNWMIGATVPVGKFAIKASYNFSDGNRAAGGNAQQLAFGADYNLSKRTKLYTAYAKIDNDSSNGSTPLVRRAAVVGDAVNTGGTFQEGFQIGMNHSF